MSQPEDRHSFFDRRGRLVIHCTVSWTIGAAMVSFCVWGLRPARDGPRTWPGYVFVNDDEVRVVSEMQLKEFHYVAKVEFIDREEYGMRLLLPVEIVRRRELRVDSIPEFEELVTADEDWLRREMQRVLREYGFEEAKVQAVLLPDDVTRSPHWFGILAHLWLPLVIGGPLWILSLFLFRIVRSSWRAAALEAGRCPNCNYDIRNLPVQRCPECGEMWEKRESSGARRR